MICYFLLCGLSQGKQVLDLPPVLPLLQPQLIIFCLQAEQPFPFFKEVGMCIA